MTNFLIRRAIKNADNPEEERRNIGYMTSIVGIVLNLVLAVVKLAIGFLISSIGVIADGFNNLADTLSSIITLIGFKLADLPPDKEHPYGHGRVEYISGLVIAFIIMLLGFQFILSSFKEIINPSPVRFELALLIILILSIFAKVWLAYFNRKVSYRINSKAIRALFIDSLGDILTASVVVISLVISRYSNIAIDGYIGIVVSILILYNGFNIVRETVSPLIGESASKEVIKGIKEDIMSYDYITGTHDLFIHSYGESKTMAVIDVEFPASLDIVKVYEEITRAEKEIGKKYGMTLIIHMDPLEEESETRYKIRTEIKSVLKNYPLYKSMHDFDIIEKDGVRIVEFDMVIHGSMIKGILREEEIISRAKSMLKKRYPNKEFKITLDVDYH